MTERSWSWQRDAVERRIVKLEAAYATCEVAYQRKNLRRTLDHWHRRLAEIRKLDEQEIGGTTPS